MHYETSWNVLLLFSGEIFGLSECGLGAEGGFGAEGNKKDNNLAARSLGVLEVGDVS